MLALPVLRAIRRARPQAGLTVLAQRGAATLFRAEGSADDVLERSGLFGDARRLRAGRFAEAWLLPNSFRAALAPRLAGIPERIGYDTDRRRRLLTQALPPPLRTEHQLRDYDALLRSRGIEPDFEAPRLPVTVKALDRGTKRWPAERYGALADLLAARGLAPAVVIGPGEEALGRTVAAAARPRLPVLGADLDPLELAALLSCARVVVSNDSGPMHLAAAVGVPVVAFFGPTDPGRTAPSGSPSKILDRYVFCSPCFLKECPFGHECMKEITAEMAFEAVKELLGLND